MKKSFSEKSSQKVTLAVRLDPEQDAFADQLAKALCFDSKAQALRWALQRLMRTHPNLNELIPNPTAA